MTEHTSLLKDYASDYDQEKKPTLDEQDLEEINIIIYESLNYCLPIKVVVWKDGYFNTLEGIVNKIDYLTKSVSLLTDDGEIIKIQIDAITKTERL